MCSLLTTCDDDMTINLTLDLCGRLSRSRGFLTAVFKIGTFVTLHKLSARLKIKIFKGVESFEAFYDGFKLPREL